MQNSGQALAQVQQAQSSAMNPNQYLAQANQSLGVNSAQDTVNGLQGAINSSTKLLQQVAPSVMGRTANSLVNSAQASKQIQNEQAPISQTLGNQTTAYNQGEQRLGQLQTEANQQAQGNYQAQQDKLSYLQNIYNTMYQQEKDQQAQANAQAAQQEQIRQFNAQLALNQQKASAGSGGYDLSSLLGSLGSSQYSTATDKSGGTQFAYQGKPITAAQYFTAQGGGFNDVLSFLKSDPQSKAAYADASSGKYTPAQLTQKYPYIFGGV